MAGKVLLEGLIFCSSTNNAQWGICASGHVMQLQLTACSVPWTAGSESLINVLKNSKIFVKRNDKNDNSFLSISCWPVPFIGNYWCGFKQNRVKEYSKRVKGTSEILTTCVFHKNIWFADSHVFIPIDGFLKSSFFKSLGCLHASCTLTSAKPFFAQEE